MAGTGIDVVSIERIRKAGQSRRFLTRVFTGAELVYSFSKRDPFKHLAGRFAAKEACIKALGAGTPGTLGAAAFNEIEVVNDTDGRPRVVLHPPGGKRAATCPGAEQDGGGEGVGPVIHLSITYSMKLAMALAVAG